MAGRLEQLDPNDPDSVIRFRAFTAKLYETTASDGTKQVAIWLQQSYRDASGEARTRELKCDLDRLEAVVNHANELKSKLENRPERVIEKPKLDEPKSVLSLGAWTAKFYEMPDSEGKGEIGVRIDRKESGPDGEQRTRSFAKDLKHLEEVVKHAIVFEHQRGHEPRWYAVVKVDSLEQQEGLVKAAVVKWIDNRENAQTFLDEHPKHGYALHPDRFRRPLGGVGFTMSVDEKLLPSLAPDIQYLKAERERVGPGLLLGIWCQHGQEPTPGTPVKFDTGMDSESRRPTDYRVVPAGVDRPQGPGPRPIAVIVEVDDTHWPPVHKIKEALPNLVEAKSRFQELKAAAIESQQQRELEQKQEPVIDLAKASLPKRPTL